MKLILSIFIGCLLVVTSSAQDAPVGDKSGNSEKSTPVPQTKYADLNKLVKRIRDGFDKAVKISDAQRDVKINALNRSYLKQLEQLQLFYNDSGNAASALTTREEIKRITEKNEIQSDQLKGDGLDQLQEKRKLYSEALKKIEESNTVELKRLFVLGNEVLKKRASDLTRKGDLDRVAALTSVIPSWANRSDLTKQLSKGTVFSANVHFFFKGEVELFHNGKKVYYRGEAVQYGVSGVSKDIKVAGGDVIAFRLRSDAGFRSLIAAVVDESSKYYIPLVLRDYCYVENTDGDDVTLAQVRESKGKPDQGKTHVELLEVWNEHRIPDAAKKASEWMTIPQKSQWVTYAVEIADSHIKTVR